METLIKASPGRYKIVKIKANCPAATRRLMILGIFEGDKIELIKPAPGPVILEKNGTRIGIGQGLAAGIVVEELKEDKDK
ncbi:MAG: ferrous iron transport protein A [Candidatus Omnitrophica bacterium]|nr:ferrous iron transport protein A [Candidatus Omnitrophota bacterium]